MPVHPVALPDYHEAAIIQRVGDIPIRTTDRLLLVDIEYHHHSAPNGTFSQPTIVLEVQQVGYMVIRQQLLRWQLLSFTIAI